MSALGGILTFGGPLDREQLSALGARLERLGPDGGREVIAGPIGMTYRAFHTNAESRREHQPYCWGHHAMLVFDGRLDNRDELLAALRDELRDEDTDAAIAMAAYLRWRRGGIAKLIGDFALALWDRRDHAVWLARDCVGTRTLYYHIDRDRLIWSTDLGPLLDISGVSIEVNDEYVAGLLTRGSAPGLTPYIGVHAVKPAHVVRIDVEGCLSERRFWELDPHREIRYRTDAEYEDHFRAVFREAVCVRLRCDAPVFAELSGGLDSSSIVSMALNVLDAGDASAPRLETVSYVYDDAPSSDERRWITEVERFLGKAGHHVLETQFRFLTPSTHSYSLPTWLLVTAAYDEALKMILSACCGRLVLSGQGGDHLLNSSSEPTGELMDLLSEARLADLHRCLLTWSAALKTPYPRLFWMKALLPLLVRRFPSRRLRLDRLSELPSWIPEPFRRRWRLEDRMTRLPEAPQTGRPSTRMAVEAFCRAVRQVGSGCQQESAGYEMTYPYLHRPFVETLVAFPITQKLRPGHTRSVMRRALSDVLPDCLVRRRGKGNPAEVFDRAIARNLTSIKASMANSPACVAGYVDAEGFAAALDRAGAGHQPHSGRMIAALTLDLWLRGLRGRERSQSTVPPRPDSMHPAVTAVFTGAGR